MTSYLNNQNAPTYTPRFLNMTVDGGINMKNSNITECGLINGIDIKALAGGFRENYVIYRPGALLNVFPIYNNWNDIKTKILESDFAIDIWIDNSLAQPILDIDINFNNRATIIAKPSTNAVTLEIKDGITVTDLNELNAVNLVGNFSIKSPLEFKNTTVLLLEKGAGILLNGNTTFPFISLNNQQVVCTVSSGSKLDNNGFSGNIIECKNSSTIILSGLSTGYYVPNIISGDITSTLYITRDSTFQEKKQVNFLGTTQLVNNDVSVAVIYDDSKVYPNIGTTNVQETLDYLKLIRNFEMYVETFNIPDGVDTNVDFKDVIIDANSQVQYNGSGNFEFTGTGTFTICYHILWENNNAGKYRKTVINTNNGIWGGSYYEVTNSDQTPQSGSVTKFFTTGDTFQIVSSQNTGADLSQKYAKISISKISP